MGFNINYSARQREIRLYSSDLYIVFDKQIGIGIGATNRNTLARHTGINYNKLRHIFGKSNKTFYEDDTYIIMKIFTDMIFKKEHKVASNNFRTKAS